MEHPAPVDRLGHDNFTSMFFSGLYNNTSTSRNNVCWPGCVNECLRSYVSEVRYVVELLVLRVRSSETFALRPSTKLLLLVVVVVVVVVVGVVVVVVLSLTRTIVPCVRGLTLSNQVSSYTYIYTGPVAPVAYQVILEPGIGQFRDFEPRRVHTRINSLGLFLVHKLTCGKRESVS